MSELTLKANTPTEERILAYLKDNASEVLAEKINAGKKTLAGAMDWARNEARALANGEQCICVDDATVFGWIIHFFEEDTIPEPEKGKAVRLPKGVRPPVTVDEPAKPAKPTKAKKVAKQPAQLDLFAELMAVKP